MESVWDKLANEYDRMWVQKYSLGPTRRKVIEQIGMLSDQSGSLCLLDVGCGTGQLVDEISRLYPDIDCTGIDQSEYMIDQALARNNNAQFFVSSAEDIGKLINGTYHIITCCHSFPYYLDKEKVLENVVQLLAPDGYIVFVQATINSLYDYLIMSYVEKKAEKAEYLSSEKFKNLLKPFSFILVDEFKIKERFYMPSISGFVYQKSNVS